MKAFTLVLIAALICAAVMGCTDGGTSSVPSAPASNLSGPTADILAELIEKAGENLSGDDFLPMTFDSEITAESFGLGLTPEQITQYVVEGTQSMAAIMTMPHEIALFQAKDAQSARILKDILAVNYDPAKWICVFPDQAFVVESGNYVLLAASWEGSAQAMLSAFTELAGNTGEPEIFFVGHGDFEGGGIESGGGMAAPMPIG